MSCKLHTNGAGYLSLRLYHEGREWREGTRATPDTVENRDKLTKLAERASAAMPAIQRQTTASVIVIMKRVKCWEYDGEADDVRMIGELQLVKGQIKATIIAVEDIIKVPVQMAEDIYFSDQQPELWLDNLSAVYRGITFKCDEMVDTEDE